MPLDEDRYVRTESALTAAIALPGRGVDSYQRLRRFELVLKSVYAVREEPSLSELSKVIGDPPDSVENMLGRFEGDLDRMRRLVTITRGVLDNQRRMCASFMRETEGIDEDSRLEFVTGQMLELAESYRCCCAGEIADVSYTNERGEQASRGYIGDHQIRDK